MATPEEVERVIAEHFGGLASQLAVAHRNRFGTVPVSLNEIRADRLRDLAAERQPQRVPTLAEAAERFVIEFDAVVEE